MFPYESLLVYKKAFDVNKTIHRLLDQNKTIPLYIKNQLGRASLSVILNIAEGSAKLGIRDRRNFYVVARGSVFECSSLLSFLFSTGEITNEVKNTLNTECDEISKMLFAMIRRLEPNAA